MFYQYITLERYDYAAYTYCNPILAYIYTTIMNIVLLRHFDMLLDQENTINGIIIRGKN